MKNANILIMTGVLITLSVLSMYFYETYKWEYNESVYNFKSEERVYDLNNPMQKWELPNELEEISGLSYFKKNELACVQDEDGYFFIYDLKKKSIVRKEKFGEKGDYEGVEVIADTAYVLKSNGHVSYFKVNQQGIGEVFKLKTDLSAKNDAEGLGFIKAKKELLVACKENPGTKKVDIEKSRSIYRITIADKKFKKKPKYVIDGKSYSKMLEDKGFSKKKHKPFKPSGVAVHPKTNFVYVIGTVGKMLIILTPDGIINDLVPLDPKIFRQPEGICFSPNGDLYISSEGKGKNGYILKF